MSNSIYNVKSFMSHNNIQEGVSFPAEVTVLSSAGMVCRDNCECRLFFNIPFQQYNCDIDWEINITGLGLYRGYNTNFQDFLFEDDCLKIRAGEKEIHITYE